MAGADYSVDWMSGDWVVWQVVVGAVFILSLLLLAIGLMFERAWRRRAEVSLGERLQFDTLDQRKLDRIGGHRAGTA